MALTPELRKKLEALNRGPLKIRQPGKGNAGASPPAPPEAPKPPAEPVAPTAPVAPAAPVTLQQAASGEVVETPFGSLYMVRRRFSGLIENAGPTLAAYRRTFVEGAASWRERSLHPGIRPLMDVDHRRVLYIDIETTGLSAQPLFLIGVMSYTGSDFEQRLLLARDYAEERAVIALFGELLHEQEAIVTYNGRSFDVPYIAERGTVHGIDLSFSGHHADLLLEARRRYRGRLPNCKLQTLERCLLNRARFGDIPGDQIPRVYHDFVRTGDARFIGDILNHNALDLAAMAEILLHMTNEEQPNC